MLKNFNAKKELIYIAVFVVVYFAVRFFAYLFGV